MTAMTIAKRDSLSVICTYYDALLDSETMPIEEARLHVAILIELAHAATDEQNVEAAKRLTNATAYLKKVTV